MLAIIIGIIVLIFLPFPIKVSFTYFDNRIFLSIYNHRIDVMRKINRAQTLKKAGIKTENKLKKKKDLFKINSDTIRNFICDLNCKKFKPFLKLKIDLNYGFDDAAATGIAYGLFNCISPIFFKAMDIFFKVKKYKYNVNPDFNSKIFKYKVEMKSIIFISLANVIYMIFMIWNKFVRLPKNLM